MFYYLIPFLVFGVYNLHIANGFCAIMQYTQDFLLHLSHAQNLLHVLQHLNLILLYTKKGESSTH